MERKTFLSLLKTERSQPNKFSIYFINIGHKHLRFRAKLKQMPALIFILIIATLSPAFSQSDYTILKGQVTLQSSGAIPIKDAQIAAVGADPTTTNSFGQFELKFISKKPGSSVRLSLIKQGYEVVNRDGLQVILRTDPDDLVFIFLCKEGDRDRNALILYEISEKNINETYEKKIAELTDEIKSLDRNIISKIDEQRQLALMEARELADRFAEINLDEASEIYKEAYESFLHGNISKALELLPDEKLDKNISDIKSEIEKSEKKTADLKKTLTQSIHNYLFKADLSIINLDFDEANKNYNKAVEADSTDFTILIIYGLFLIDQKQYNYAETVFKKAAEIMSDSQGRFIAYHYLGMIYTAESLYYKALEVQKKAVTSYGLFIKDTTSDVSMMHVELAISMFMNLASSYEMHNQPDSALIPYGYLQDVFFKLLKEKAEDYYEEHLYYVAEVQYKIGNLKKDKKYYQEALDYYNQYLDYIKNLIHNGTEKKNPQHLSGIIKAYDGMFQFYCDTKQFEEGVKFFELESEFLKQYYEPKDYMPILAYNYIRISILHLGLNNIPNRKAMEAIIEGSNIYKILAKSNPQRYLPEVALNISTLAIYQRALGEYENSINSYKESLDIYINLSKDNPSAYLKKVAQNYRDISKVYELERKTLGEIEALKNSAIYYEQLEKDNPGFYLEDLASVYTKIGILQISLEQDTEASKSFNSAMKYLNELERVNVKNLLSEDAVNIFIEFGDYYSKTQRYDSALIAYEKAKSISEELAQQDSQFNLSFAKALITLSIFHVTLIEYDPKESYKTYGFELAEKAETILKEYPENKTAIEWISIAQQSEEYFKNASIKCLLLSKEAKDCTIRGDEIVKKNGPITEAESYYKKAIENYEELIKKENDLQYLSPLSLAYESLYNLDKSAQVKVNQNNIINLIDELYKEYANKPEVKITLAEQCGSIAWGLLFRKEYQDAEKVALKGLEIDPSQEWIKTNLAHAYLFQDKIEDAKAVYLGLLDKTYGGKSFKEILLQDFQDLEKAGVTNTNMEAMRQLITK